MSSSQELREERLKKLARLKEAGFNPYPAEVGHTHSLKEAEEHFDDLLAREQPVTVAGRIMSQRRHGGSIFLDLFDGSGPRLQIFLSREVIGNDSFTLFSETIDSGDFIAVSGTAFYTKRGARAIAAADWKLLTKSLQPVPAEHFGLKDEDERYRKRYLDLLLDRELADLFVKKAAFWDSTRAFFKQKGFLEVETPMLEITTGGAEARPFRTHHNDYDLDVYLRISVGELWQKRLMAAGFPKTFELGRAFRNEGTSPEHLQEFTNLEFYWAYANYRDGMSLVQELYRTLANEVFGTTAFSLRGHKFDLLAEWPEIDYVDEVKKQAGVDVLSADETELKAALEKLSVEYEGGNRERLTDSLWKHCRRQIAGPAFLTGHPEFVAPLAKSIPGTGRVEMFQPIIAGSEVGRGYSELNDPLEQARRFAEQQALLEAGDEEAMMPDDEFVEMLEYGMPPACGFGFGERLFAFLAGKTLRETQLFPLMRPR